MNVGDYGTLGRLIFDSGTVKSQLDTLTAQAGSGLVSSSYGGLGAAAQTPLSLAPQIVSLATRQTTIGAVTGRMSVTQTAMTQIASIASSFNAQIADLNTVTPTQIDSVAVAARTALQEVAGLLDSTDGSTYVFGGTDSATPPVPNPGLITSSAFYTQIGTAVAALGTNGGAATIASTLATATSNAAGTTPFSGAPGQAPTVDLGTGAPVQVGVLANANTLAVSGGSATTGSYMRDIMRSLATLSNLTSGQATAPGFAALVSDTGASLSGAITAMGIEQGALGGIQSSLTTVGTEAGETSTALSAQVSSVEDVDMAKTLSDLSQVQTQLTASYKLISEVKGLSLANFL
jgi:flagellar hook-associated protein 3 FlgL